MEFHEKLTELRKQKGWSQEELGNRLNVTRQTVSKWELAQTTPEMEKLVELSQLFDISLDELLNNPRFSEQKGLLPNGNWKDLNHYEYKSKKMIHGIPLVHVNVRRMGLATARGIIAIGNAAVGVVAIGSFSLGVISLGGLGLGLFTLAGMAAGLISIGGVSIGLLAIGGLAVGGVAIGGCAIGSYALGGSAIADKIAVGHYAEGTVAVGEKVKGAVTFQRDTPVNGAELERAIFEKFPGTWSFFVDIIKKICKAG